MSTMLKNISGKNPDTEKVYIMCTNKADTSTANLKVTHFRTDQLFGEEFAPNLHTTLFSEKSTFFANNH